MPLQNRVTPAGDIVADPHRGMFTGNRGIIHDPATKTLLRKRWSTDAWLTCVLEFRGRRRKVMTRQSWTELLVDLRADDREFGESRVDERVVQLAVFP